MPNRIIKESIHTSDTVNQMTDFQFRLWVSLITYVDDYGRGDARPAIIKGQCFPLRERLTLKDIQAGLAGLADIGCVNLYTVDGKPFLCLPSWEEHQRIRQKVSRFPAPEDADDDDRSRQVAANCGEVRLESNPNPNTNPNTNTNPNPNSKRDTRRRARESAAKKFVPPTATEVYLYCRERGNSVDANAFWEYYDAGGWKDTKGNPVRNWKQKVITWEKYDTKPPDQPERASSFDTDEFMLDELKQTYGETAG